MTCRYQVEIDPFCNKVLEKHWPNVTKYKNVKEVGGNNLESVNLICGGFPCQDISRARFGSGLGLVGERSGLWFEFARIIDETTPEWVIIENNPPLLTSNNGRDFTTIIQTLVGYGYGLSWRVLNSSYFLPNARKRLFIVASLAGIRSTRKVLFEQNEVSPILFKGKEKRDTLPMCIGWDGGLSYERLRQCVVTKVNASRARKNNGIPRWLDKHRYTSLKNAVCPPIAQFIGTNIMKQYKEQN